MFGTKKLGIMSILLGGNLYGDLRSAIADGDWSIVYALQGLDDDLDTYIKGCLRQHLEGLSGVFAAGRRHVNCCDVPHTPSLEETIRRVSSEIGRQVDTEILRDLMALNQQVQGAVRS